MESENICRACLTENSTFQSVFQAETEFGLSTSISEMMKACATIQITEGDGLPDQICTQCADETVKMYSFKLKCENSDTILRERLKKVPFCFDNLNFKNTSQLKNNKPLVKLEIKTESESDDFSSNYYEKMSEKEKTTHYKDLSLKQCVKAEEFECDICQEKFSQNDLLSNHKIVHSIKMDEIEIKHEDLQVNQAFIDSIITKSFNEISDLEEIKTRNDKKPLLCSTSSKGFEQINILEQRNVKNTKKKVLLCNICGKSFVRKSQLSAHLRRHTVKKPFVYPKNNHKKINLNNKDYECDICKKTINSNYMVRHKRIHTGEKPFECDKCQMKFSQISHLNVHYKTHTGEKPHECDVCKKTFASSSCLARHHRIHTGEKPYECEICKRRFTELGNLIKHKVTHTDEKPYECDVCGIKYTQLGHLNTHKRIHTGEKLHECDVCNKAFLSLPRLERHKRTHTGEKPFECDICSKKFTELAYLKKHQIIHVSEKLFECDFCQKKFVSSAYLANHKKIHLDERSVSKRQYECEICQKIFLRTSNLARHKRIHTGEKPYECDVCDKKFAQMCNLTKHKITHTGEKPYECDVCEKKFRKMDNLRKHKVIHTVDVGSNVRIEFVGDFFAEADFNS